MTVGSNGTQMVPLPPDQSFTQSIGHFIVNTNTSTAVQSFGKAISCTHPTPSDESVDSVSTNERAYYGLDFESNINRLNWILLHMAFTYLMIGCSIINLFIYPFFL